MAETIRKGRYRDLAGRDWHVWVRRALILAIAALPVLALINLFGQAPRRSEADTPAASLTVSGPTRLRGGLLYQIKVNVVARRRLAQPKLVFDKGFLDGQQVNTIEPQPSQELNRDGRVAFEYDAIAAGEQLTVWIDYQNNPTNVGEHTQRVELDDGETPIATVTRHLMSFP